MSKPLSILLVSGSLDRIVAALNLAGAALALGRATRVFVAWDPLLRLARKTLNEAELAADGQIDSARVREVLAVQGNLDEMLQDLRGMGLEVYACSNTMAMAGLDVDDLDGLTDGAAGATAFLEMSSDGDLLSF